MKILVVESDEAQRRRISLIFDEASRQSSPSQVQYEVFGASNTLRALELFNSVHPDLILIMTQAESIREGTKLCKEIRDREEQRHTGVIFVAMSACDDMAPVECLEVGADDFLPVGVTPREIVARVNSVLRMKSMTDELRSANHRLEVLSLTDELTGLHNMRSFNIQYTNLLNRCRMGESGLGVIMADLDKFKSINDKTNHLVGSHVISEVGKLMRLSGVLGDHSCGARYGGDEYVMCCLAASVYEVMEKAENLRKLIENAVFKKEEFTVNVTSSIGVAWIDPCFDGKFDDPIKAADVMLYRSKHHGKNQVNAMILRYPVDFDHIGRPHLVDRDASGEDNNVPRANNF
jgi:diguanylate cyclase (GGDEF)-like protein